MNKRAVIILVLCTLLTAYLGESEAGSIVDKFKEKVAETIVKTVEVVKGDRGIVITKEGVSFGPSNQEVIMYSLLGVGAFLALLICCCACCLRNRAQTV